MTLHSVYNTAAPAAPIELLEILISVMEVLSLEPRECMEVWYAGLTLAFLTLAFLTPEGRHSPRPSLSDCENCNSSAMTPQLDLDGILDDVITLM